MNKKTKTEDEALKVIDEVVDDLVDIILTTKHEKDEYDSDSESYTHVFEHKFLKQEKKYLNLFNWKCPYVPAERLSFFSL